MPGAMWLVYLERWAWLLLLAGPVDERADEARSAGRRRAFDRAGDLLAAGAAIASRDREQRDHRARVAGGAERSTVAGHVDGDEAQIAELVIELAGIGRVEKVTTRLAPGGANIDDDVVARRGFDLRGDRDGGRRWRLDQLEPGPLVLGAGLTARRAHEEQDGSHGRASISSAGAARSPGRSAGPATAAPRAVGEARARRCRGGARSLGRRARRGRRSRDPGRRSAPRGQRRRRRDVPAFR